MKYLKLFVESFVITVIWIAGICVLVYALCAWEKYCGNLTHWSDMGLVMFFSPFAFIMVMGVFVSAIVEDRGGAQ